MKSRCLVPSILTILAICHRSETRPSQRHRCSLPCGGRLVIDGLQLKTKRPKQAHDTHLQDFDNLIISTSEVHLAAARDQGCIASVQDSIFRLHVGENSWQEHA